MIDRRYKEAPRNVCLELQDEESLDSYRYWAKVGRGSAKGTGSIFIMQISHPGRQCPMSVCTKPLAPSAITLHLKGIPKVVSPVITPREATEADIKDIIARFGHTARLAEKAGFDGVQVLFCFSRVCCDCTGERKWCEGRYTHTHMHLHINCIIYQPTRTRTRAHAHAHAGSRSAWISRERVPIPAC